MASLNARALPIASLALLSGCLSVLNAGTQDDGGQTATTTGGTGATHSTGSTGATRSTGSTGQMVTGASTSGSNGGSSTGARVTQDGGFPQAFSPTTLAGSGTPGSQNGSGQSTSFDDPIGLALDSSGNLYVADRLNQLVRKVDPAGNVTTAANLFGLFCGSQETTLGMNIVTGVAVDASNRLFVVKDNCVHVVDAAGDITTFAGNGIIGFMNGTGGPQGTAEFNAPYSLAIDLTGNVLVTDWNNGRIRRVDPAGNVTSVAGSGATGFHDGPAGMAEFDQPKQLAVDSLGDIIVADAPNERIRKIDPSGNVTTLAGNGTEGYANGTGGPNGTAEFDDPEGVAVDAAGNVLVADSNNSRIRRIDPQGNVTTVAGNGTPGTESSSDLLRYPVALVVDSDENLYVACVHGYDIVKLTPSW